MTKRIVHMEGGDSKSGARRQWQRIPASDLFKKVTTPGATFEVSLGRNTDSTISNFVNDGRRGHVLLLVDSDGTVETDAISYLRAQGKTLPADVAASDVHLMVHTMETWLVADPTGLSLTFTRLDANKLPSDRLEERDRHDILRALNRALGGAGSYDKVKGLSALAHLDPATIEIACPSAHRFFDRLRAAG